MSTGSINAADVADFFIDLCKETKHPMTNLRLNKMLYFAQGWYLTTYGEPLFKEHFQAWENGPVIPSVYNANKNYHASSIRKVSNLDYIEKFKDSQVGEFLIDVCNRYEDRSTRLLVSDTRAEGTPWRSIYDGTSDKDIPQSVIKSYFDKLPPLKRFDVRNLKNIPIADASGKRIYSVY